MKYCEEKQSQLDKTRGKNNFNYHTQIQEENGRDYCPYCGIEIPFIDD